MRKIITQQISERAWKHLFSGFACLVIFLVAGVSTAQTNNPQVERQGKNAAGAEVKSKWDALEKLSEKIQEWKSEDVRGFIKRDDIIVVDGTALANLNTGDKRWGKSRSNAYSKAFLNAMKKYAMSQYSKYSETLKFKYLEKDVDENDLIFKKGEPGENYAARVAKKIGMLGERKLNEALTKTGMSADEIKRLTPKQKICQMSANMVKEATDRAVGSAAGLLPVQTFEAIDNEGNSAIGVMVVASPRYAFLAKQISTHKSIRPIADKKGAPIYERIKAFSDDQLIDMFGPRVMWDEHGFPTVVAFGQWVWSSNGLNKRKKARRRSFAIKQAESDAVSHLSTFISAGTRFVETSRRGGISKECLVMDSDKTVDQADTTKIIDERWEEATVRSNIDLTGRLVRRTWFGEHPKVKGSELVGVVVSWSPRQEDRIRRVQGKNPKHQPITKTNKRNSKKKVFSEGTRKSPDIMKAKDF